MYYSTSAAVRLVYIPCNWVKYNCTGNRLLSSFEQYPAITIAT